jgi:uncharacterized protein (TIGR03437 family)
MIASAGSMFGQASQANPGSLGAIFASQFGAQLAAAATATVSITANGVVPVYSTATTIQAGSWISIYGSNLASGNATWNGDFPQTLGGTAVTINQVPAYLWFVSPGQINAQVPDLPGAAGTVPVAVTNDQGTATSTVTLGQFGPSFSLLDATHVAGIIARPDGSGANGSGAGSYDIIGPTGSALGFPTKAAKAGDVVELFGVGFGPTVPAVPAGAPFSGAAPAAPQSNIQILINGSAVPLAFAGMTGAGLFQFNLTIPPGLGAGDLPLTGVAGGVQTPAGPVISLQ